MPMTAAFDAYVAPARRRPALWRLGLGTTLVAAFWLAAVLVAFVPVVALRGPEVGARWLDRVGHGSDPVGALILLSTFAGPLAGALLASRLLHGRGPQALLGPPRRAARDFGRTASIVAGVYALSLVAWSLAFDSVPGRPPGAWIATLPLALALLAVQTGAEEVVFRGYLQGQLAARSRSPAVWLVLPSLLFGAVHWDPEAGPGDALAVVGVTTLFGLVAADLTARTGTLGAAWGLHLANNAVALLLLATPGALPGLALRLTPYAKGDAPATSLLVADAVSLVVVWAIARRVLGHGHPAGGAPVDPQAKRKSE